MTGMSDAADQDDYGVGIAVIGMACRFPGADGPEAFWRNLTDGVDSVTRLPARPVPGRVNGSKAEYVPARGLLEGAEWFDAGYFGYSPRDARLISPQHRVFLECGVEALEAAGCDPARYLGVIGVYAGSTETAYAQILKSQRASLPPMTDWEILVANGADFLASRLAYKLGLRGPAVVVQAACATSLVAVHLAIQALLAGDCDLALAGGIAVHAPAKDSYYTEGGILSASGICAAFDAAANGTVGGDGVGLVVLKRLADALDDGDHIHAVIRGSAVSNDGGDRIGYTAPSVAGQAAAVRTAQLVAGVDAETVTYVEAHGTATPLGDPIEVAALTKAFRSDTDRRGFCRIGSVKTNIGHTDAAAGAAGLIKTVMALEHALIPPSLHFSKPNPGIDFDTSPFRVATELADWQPDGTPRRAGVSAAGIGGTNAHVVLEEPPAPAEPGQACPARPWQLLVLSARSPAALDAAAERLASHLREHPELPLADVAWSLQAGRQEHSHRGYAIVSALDDARDALTDARGERLITSSASPRPAPVALMFPGSGGGQGGTGVLYRTEPEFRRRVDECCACAPRNLSADVRAAIDLDEEPDAPTTADLVAFVREYALARLWLSWGVQPAAVLGAGPGALTAAAVAGVFRLPDAIRLVIARAGLAAVVGDTSDPGGTAADTFCELVHAMGPRAPEIPVVSASRGRKLSGVEAADPAYWAGHLWQEERLDEAVSTLLADADQVLVELGTGHVLGCLARQRPEYTAGHLIVPALTNTTASLGGPPATVSALGRLWLAGVPVSWAGVHDGERRVKVPLPAYPFQRQRYFVEPDESFPVFADGPVTCPAASWPDPGQPDTEPLGSRAPDHDAAAEGRVAGSLSVVTGLFATMLGMPGIDRDDSFFDLGGDSLTGAELLDEVHRSLLVDLDLESLYDAPTASSLSAIIDKHLAGLRVPQATE